MFLFQILSVSLAWLRKWGGAGLVALGLMDGSLVPIPGGLDFCTALLAGTHKNFWFYYALMSTAGSVSGGYLIYRIAKKGGKETLKKRFPRDKMERVDKMFERWGFGAVLIAAILPPPLPTVPFLAGAGALNYPARKFVSALAIARFVRFTVVAYLASLYGKHILRLLQTLNGRLFWTIVLTVIVLAVTAGAVIVVYRYRSRKTA